MKKHFLNVKNVKHFKNQFGLRLDQKKKKKITQVCRVAELHSISHYQLTQLTQLTGRSAESADLFVLSFHAGFRTSYTQEKMLKRFLIFSLIMVAVGADFRFGGVSFVLLAG
jgi:hypothetical protein